MEYHIYRKMYQEIYFVSLITINLLLVYDLFFASSHLIY